MSSMSMMNRYVENNCRLCRKCFCCPKCRAKHERAVHNIFPECSICVYGKMVLKKPSQALMVHIKEAHWPLHCVYCKRIFDADDFNQHSKCPIGKSRLDLVARTPLVPKILMECYDGVDSPPVEFSGFLLVAITSTPRDSMRAIQINETPIDRMAKIKNANENLSSQTPSVYDENKRAEKRRVTFSQTPMVENPKKKPQGFLKGSLKKYDMFKDENISNRFSTTIDNERSFTKYESATSKSQSQSVTTLDRSKRRRSSLGNDTLWESALNDSADFIDEKPPKRRMIDSGSSVSSDEAPKEVDSIVQTETPGLWSSMAYLMKSVVQGIAGSGPERRKRFLSDSDCISDLEIKQLKKIKLTDIKCRPPIRSYKMLHLQYQSPKVGRGTQTD
ncbi:PREDICTED: uncharacterized protein LOC108565333 isoform X2 [Nicrophorus vespilloides]|uniref:Uncharacterized protein LOC108565333 isoform X2 n=1 Tax=Nicrophorus vespilloides TaxID=110193 RepID=A0ABM1N092_NICVS|nr:PREDICTED: uncharacterized protein LOC108565333 isoform X2 [Nicrophorus vespilloides]